MDSAEWRIPSGVEIDMKDWSVLETISKRPSASVSRTVKPSVTATPPSPAFPAATRPEIRTGRTPFRTAAWDCGAYGSARTGNGAAIAAATKAACFRKALRVRASRSLDLGGGASVKVDSSLRPVSIIWLPFNDRNRIRTYADSRWDHPHRYTRSV